MAVKRPRRDSDDVDAPPRKEPRYTRASIRAAKIAAAGQATGKASTKAPKQATGQAFVKAPKQAAGQASTKAPKQVTGKASTKAPKQAVSVQKVASKKNKNASPSKAPALAQETKTKASVGAATQNSVHVTDVVGDLFKAPEGSILVHACNCQGEWGGGIAAIFRKRYPGARKAFQKFSNARSPKKLLGTAYLIPPSESKEKPQHYIGCLFTSEHGGSGKDSEAKILRATETAMKDLLRQIAALADGNVKIPDVHMCRINAGIFQVPWNSTKKVIESLDIKGGLEIMAWEV